MNAGYVYCNIPALEVALNSTVRFVMLGMGSEADMHSPTFTGQVGGTAGVQVY